VKVAKEDCFQQEKKEHYPVTFLNDAHLNSGSNGIGGLLEPPHITSFLDVATQGNPNHWSCPRKPCVYNIEIIILVCAC